MKEEIGKSSKQDLSRENIGHEPEEQQKGNSDSPYKLKGLDDKRPESDEIEKGWTVDSNTSRGPAELEGEQRPDTKD